MDTKLTDELRRLISSSFKSPESEWWVRDLSKSYKFFEDEQLVWIIDGETNESLLFYRQLGKEWSRLNDEKTGVPVINKILLNKPNRAPSPKNNTEQFAKLLMEWVQEPRGYVCSPSFLKEKSTEIKSYLVKGSAGIDELKRICITPEYLASGDNWILKFNVLDVNGSIQQWRVSGKTSVFGIEKIYRESIYPNGTFYYPDEL